MTKENESALMVVFLFSRQSHTYYSSAVSMKLQPFSLAKSSCPNASSLVFWTAQVMVPRHASLTTRSEPPSRRALLTADETVDSAEATERDRPEEAASTRPRLARDDADVDLRSSIFSVR